MAYRYRLLFSFLVICLLQPGGIRAADADVFVQLGHRAPVSSLAYSADGRRLVSSSLDGTVRLWDTTSGREIFALRGHQGAVAQAALSADGQRIVSGGRDRTVRVWSAATGKQTHALTGHENIILSVVMTPEGSLAASSSLDGAIKLWDLVAGKEVSGPGGQGVAARALRYSRDGRILAAAFDDGGVKVWGGRGSESGRDVARLNTGLNAVAVTSDGTRIAVGGRDGRVFLIDHMPAAAPRLLSEVGTAVSSLEFSDDGTRLAIVSQDRSVRLLDVQSGRLMSTLDGGSELNAVAWSPTGDRLAAAGFDQIIREWRMPTGKPDPLLGRRIGEVRSVATSADGRSLAIGGTDRRVHVWDMSSGRQRRVLDGLDGGVEALDMTPDGRWLIGGSQDRKARVWSLSSGEVRTLEGHSGPVYAAAISADGQLAATGSGNTIRIWDLNSSTSPRQLVGHSGSVRAVAFAPDGKILASASYDDTVRLWDVTTGRELTKLQGHVNRVNSVSFSRDGHLLVSAGDDASVKVWQLADHRLLTSFSGHSGPVRAARFAPDGRRIYSVGLDGSLMQWDVSTGKGSAPATPGLGPLFALAVSERHVSIAGDTGVTKVLHQRGSAEAVELYGFAGSDWVAITNDGYFDGSSDGFRYLNVRLGAEVHGLDQFAESFYRPDRVREALGGILINTTGSDAADAARKAEAERRQRMEQERLAAEAKERDRQAQAEREHFAREALERARLEAERAARLERDRQEQMERDRLAALSAEKLRIEAERRTKEEREQAAKLEKERLIRAEADRAREEAEQQRIVIEQQRAAAEQLARREQEQQRPRQRITEVKPAPRVSFVRPPTEARTEAIELQLVVIDQGGGIGDVRLYLNGTAVLLNSARTLKVMEQRQGEIVYSHRLRVVNGRNAVRAVAFNADNSMQSQEANHEIDARISGGRRPTLHALIVGIDEFRNPALRLRYSVADAKLFASTLEKGAASLFESVKIRRLISPRDTTREAIMAALSSMHQDVGPEDLFVFYAASHGTVDDGIYYLITSNVGSTATARLRSDAIDQNLLKELLGNVPATKKLIVMDTCNAGALGDGLQVALLTRGLSEDRAIKVLSRAVGVTTLYASSSTQEALEGYRNHGLFTWVLTQGLMGKADSDRDGFIKTIELADFVDSQVPEVAESVFGHKQYPIVSPTGMGFPITRPH